MGDKIELFDLTRAIGGVESFLRREIGTGVPIRKRLDYIRISGWLLKSALSFAVANHLTDFFKERESNKF